MEEKKLNHFDDAGKALMVDVGGKGATLREATACGRIRMGADAFAVVQAGTAAKGDVLGAARIAGIMATKQCSSLIPLCHPVMIEKAAVDFEPDAAQYSITARCTVQTTGKTGVEMEALCGATVALLTIYDMCKALDKAMVLEEVHLQRKSGGKSGDFTFVGQHP